MSNIYVKVTTEKNLTVTKLRFSRFKKFTTRSGFEELQLTQNFQTSCCNLKTRSLGAKLSVAFLIHLF